MNNATVDFFNGASARPYKVRVEVSIEKIFLSDDENLANTTLSYPLAQCHYILSPTSIFVYLSEGFDIYVAVPTNTDLYETLYKALKSTKPLSWYNRLLQQNKIALVVLLLALVCGIYMILTEAIPLAVVTFISKKEEAALGEKLYQSVIKEATIDTALSTLSNQFVNNIDLSDQYPIQVTVLKDDQVNAFELPGGHIIVYSGILPYMHSQEEFVALLSHEASHINNRHSLKAIAKSISSSLALSIILNDAGGVTKGIIENANSIYSLNYSRSLERQADGEGLKLMVKNNIDPKGMKRLMQDLLKAEKDLPTSMSFLSNHPLTKERIKNIDDFIKEHPKYTVTDHPVLVSIWNEIKVVDDAEENENPTKK
jgi:predicted Zn-dependent protease